ncbi:glycosyltransferase [Holophaga foetida]|uniref:glycosyltransferase n=1 Tax=Holophaga foetida TaxID=35839 RepID=UPI0002473F41|nr:glycosyltransferase [Holophaga foetida]
MSAKERPRALFLTPSYPSSGASGGLVVTQERLRVLASFFDLTVLSLEGEQPATPITEGSHLAAGHLRPRRLWVWLCSLAYRLPLSIFRNHSKELLELSRQMGSRPFHLIYVDHWLMIPAAYHLKGPYRVLHLHNAEHQLLERAALQMKGIKAWVTRCESVRAMDFLRRWLASFDEIHFLSQDDLNITQRDCGYTLPAKVFLPAVQIPCEPGPLSNRQSALLFVGSLSWHPNTEGLTWFLAEVWPWLQGLRLDVVGNGAPASLLAQAGKHAEVYMKGFIEDLDAYYQSARVFIAPLLSGSGVKIKVIHALAHGLPIVTTSIGAEGLPELDKTGLLVADTPTEFAQFVDILVRDDEVWQRCSELGKSYASKYLTGNSFADWASEAAMTLTSAPHSCSY